MGVNKIDWCQFVYYAFKGRKSGLHSQIGLEEVLIDIESAWVIKKKIRRINIETTINSYFQLPGRVINSKEERRTFEIRAGNK